MRRVFLTTVKRGSNKELTGYLLELNWYEGTIKQKVAIPEPSIEKEGFWNPRGGNRGCRGIKHHNGFLYVATATTIRKLDRTLNLVQTITHPLFSGIHDILVDDEGITISCSLRDLILKVDFEGNTLWKKFLGPYEDKDTMHINNLCVHQGNLLFLSCKNKQIYELNKNGSCQLLIEDGGLGAPHDICSLPNGNIAVNNTQGQSVCIYSLEKHKRVRTISTNVHSTKHRSVHFARAGWQRGMTHFAGASYLVGTSPLTVFLLNLQTGKVDKIVKLSNNVAHCSYNICVTEDF